MEPKKVLRLMDLAPGDRLPVMAEGLRLLAHNVEAKYSDAASLFGAGRTTSADFASWVRV